jgi:superkiller protein 3
MTILLSHKKKSPLNLKILLFSLVLASSIFAQERIIAIGPFENKGQPVDSWLETGIRQVLYDKFYFNDKIQVTSPELLDRLLTKLTNGNIYNISPRAAYKLNKESATEIMLIGSYKIKNRRVAISYKVLNMYTGSPIFSNAIQDDLENILEVINKVGLDFAEKTEIPMRDKDIAKLNEKITNSSKAFQHYCKAYVEFHHTPVNYPKVMSEFKKAISLDPNFWEAQFNLATVLYNTKKYKSSLDQFSEVIKRHPKFYKAYFGRGLIYLKFKRFKKALKEFERVKKADPDNKEVDYYLGMLYNRTDKLLDAINSLQQAIRKNPEMAAAQYELGLAYFKRNSLNKAIRYLKEAIRLKPDYASAHHTLGQAYVALKQYDNAIFEYKKSIESFPNYANAYFDLGNAYYKQGVLQEFISNYLDIVNTAEDSKTRVTKSKVISPNMRKTYNNIIAALRKAVEIDPEFYEAHFNLALTLHKYGEYTEAQKEYERTLELNPTLIKAHMQYGYLLEEQGLYNEALAEFKKVVRIRPDYFDPKSTLGENYHYKNPITEVEKEALAMLKKNPNDLDSRLVLAKIYDVLGKRSKALVEYQAVVKLNPADRYARKRMKELKAKLN